ncbi:hypothetical protein N431DRAFT_465291, partial [Stipitochalara longipes BDJ]
KRSHFTAKAWLRREEADNFLLVLDKPQAVVYLRKYRWERRKGGGVFLIVMSK